MNLFSRKALLSMLAFAAMQTNVVFCAEENAQPKAEVDFDVFEVLAELGQTIELNDAWQNKNEQAEPKADKDVVQPQVPQVGFDVFAPLAELELAIAWQKQSSYKERARAQLSAIWTTLNNHRKKSAAAAVAVAAIGALLVSKYGAELREQVGSSSAVQAARSRVAQSGKSVRSFVSNNQDAIKKAALRTGAALVAAFGGKKAWRYFAKKA